ncbi:MAG: MEDS domain-containing protein, partial [Acidobacteria bacterium]|nr:MEDS domain-containing protein [Acidobacteriota bacterium]
MTTQRPDVHLAGSVLEKSRHVCAFFHTRAEEYQTLLPFIREGFEAGDKAFHIVESSHIPVHFTALAAAGIDTERARFSGQLEVLPWEQAYL